MVSKLKSKKETRSGKKVRKGKKKKPIRIDLMAGFDKSGKLATVRMFFGPHNFISALSFGLPKPLRKIMEVLIGILP